MGRSLLPTKLASGIISVPSAGFSIKTLNVRVSSESLNCLLYSSRSSTYRLIVVALWSSVKTYIGIIEQASFIRPVDGSTTLVANASALSFLGR